MDLASLTFFDILLIIVLIVVITYFSFKTGGQQKKVRQRQNLRKHESDKELVNDLAKNASGDQEGLARMRGLLGRP